MDTQKTREAHRTCLMRTISSINKQISEYTQYVITHTHLHENASASEAQPLQRECGRGELLAWTKGESIVKWCLLKWFLTAGVAEAAVWAWSEGRWACLREAVEANIQQQHLTQKKIPLTSRWIYIWANSQNTFLYHNCFCGLPTQAVTVVGNIAATWCIQRHLHVHV